jgi:hypothetical protein
MIQIMMIYLFKCCSLSAHLQQNIKLYGDKYYSMEN